MTSVDSSIRSITANDARGRVCSTELADGPWAFDRPQRSKPAYGPGASQDDLIPLLSPMQGGIPEVYRTASMDELVQRAWDAKAALGERLTILGHFYQRDEVVQF